jgi:hypothetical protein
VCELADAQTRLTEQDCDILVRRLRRLAPGFLACLAERREADGQLLRAVDLWSRALQVARPVVVAPQALDLELAREQRDVCSGEAILNLLWGSEWRGALRVWESLVEGAAQLRPEQRGGRAMAVQLPPNPLLAGEAAGEAAGVAAQHHVQVYSYSFMAGAALRACLGSSAGGMSRGKAPRGRFRRSRRSAPSRRL